MKKFLILKTIYGLFLIVLLVLSVKHTLPQSSQLWGAYFGIWFIVLMILISYGKYSKLNYALTSAYWHQEQGGVNDFNLLREKTDDYGDINSILLAIFAVSIAFISMHSLFEHYILMGLLTLFVLSILAITSSVDQNLKYKIECNYMDIDIFECLFDPNTFNQIKTKNPSLLGETKHVVIEYMVKTEVELSDNREFIARQAKYQASKILKEFERDKWWEERSIEGKKEMKTILLSNV